jgi:ATP-dependent DNA ligase
VLPSRAAIPPSGPLWVHELKHDGYRLMVRRDGSRVRCFTRNGHDCADRFPAIVDAALRLKASSFLIDGEAVIARDDGTPDFHALRSRRRGQEAVLFGDGPTVFEHVCRMGLEGIVSKRTDAPYRGGPSRRWVKSNNPASAAVRREREEEWR